jgi:hypothetical protein
MKGGKNFKRLNFVSKKISSLRERYKRNFEGKNEFVGATTFI